MVISYKHPSQRKGDNLRALCSLLPRVVNLCMCIIFSHMNIILSQWSHCLISRVMGIIYFDTSTLGTIFLTCQLVCLLHP